MGPKTKDELVRELMGFSAELYDEFPAFPGAFTERQTELYQAIAVKLNQTMDRELYGAFTGKPPAPPEPALPAGWGEWA